MFIYLIVRYPVPLWGGPIVIGLLRKALTPSFDSTCGIPSWGDWRPGVSSLRSLLYGYGICG